MKQPSSFLEVLDKWPSGKVRDLIYSRTADDVKAALDGAGAFSEETAAALLSPAAAEYKEQIRRNSAAARRMRFGNAVHIFDPLYVANYCTNGCRYCAFNSSSKATVRKALTIDEAEAEALFMAKSGLRNILLLSGEDPRYSPPEYFMELARRIKPYFADISVEIYACSEDDYRRLAEAGVDGMTMFQETYNKDVYRQFHPYGPKSNFENRIETFDRAARGGMTFIGLGALLGLNDWREEGFYLALHSNYLRRKYWRSSIAFSFPRIRPCTGGTPPPFPVDDESLVQLMCSLRIMFPDNAITVSTREAPGFREKLVELCATKISAGAKTTPGGYSKKESPDEAQFEANDTRSLAEMSAALKAAGFDPVLKDWDETFK